MTVSVAISDEAKALLDELQTEIRLETGKQVTQQALLKRLIDDAYESRGQLVDTYREQTVPASKAEIEAFHQGTFDSGTETDEADLDDICY